MNLIQAGAAAPRQALVLALMEAICARRDVAKTRTGSFLAISCEAAVIEPLCGLVGSGLSDGQGALVVVYQCADTDELDGLVLVRRVGDRVIAQAVDPYWPHAQRRLSLIPRSCRARAFRIDDKDELRESPLPANADLSPGTATAWQRIAEAAQNGGADASQWAMASLTPA